MATITITSHVIKLGHRIIQISNISEASLWKDVSTPKKARKAIGFGILIVVGCALVANSNLLIDQNLLVLGILSGLTIIVIACFFLRPAYDLLLQTNAGRVIPMASKDHGLMQRVLNEIQDSMTHRDPAKNVSINVGNAIVNSQIGSNIGGNVSNSIR